MIVCTVMLSDYMSYEDNFTVQTSHLQCGDTFVVSDITVFVAYSLSMHMYLGRCCLPFTAHVLARYYRFAANLLLIMLSTPSIQCIGVVEKCKGQWISWNSVLLGCRLVSHRY